MVTSRISENYRYDSMIDRITDSKSFADQTNDAAASGRKLKNLSDDPVAVVRTLRNRGQVANIDQFRKSIEFGRGFLTKTEDTLSSIYDAMVRAKELAIQQANGTYNDSARSATSAEIRQLMEHINILGNSRYNDKFVFGGFQTSVPPVAPDGSYLGDDGRIFIQIDEDSFRTINVSGRAVFGVPPGSDNERPPLLQVMKNLYESIDKNNREGLHQSMVDLDKAMDTVLMEMSSLGARQVALNDIWSRIDKSEEQVQNDLSRLDAVDPTKAALDLRRAENALQFTLQASSRMLTPSLLAFLK
jgi:flagellar hook-associated protein 3 FlgL